MKLIFKFTIIVFIFVLVIPVGVWPNEPKETRLFLQATNYLKAKNYSEAMETLNIFIKRYPQSKLISEAYLNKAEALYALGRLNDAIDSYKYILANFLPLDYPDVVNGARYGLAWSYLKLGRFKEATKEFEHTLEPGNSPLVRVSSQIQMADAYQETEDYQKALDIYNRVLEDFPKTVYADYIQFQIGVTFLKQGNFAKAFLALGNLETDFPDSKLIPLTKFYIAVGHFSLKSYSKAKALLESFIDKFPQNELRPKAYYLYGKCFFNQKNYQEALPIFKKIIEDLQDKDISELAYIDISNTYFNLAEFEMAERILKRFLGKYPHSQYRDSVLLRLGELYWNREDMPRAKRYFTQLAEGKSPLSLEAKLYLGKMFKQAKDYEQAVVSFRQASSGGADSLEAIFSLGFCLEKLGREEEAKNEYFKIVSDPVSQNDYKIKAYFRIAKIYEKENDLESAEEIYKKVVASGVEEAKIAKVRLEELERR